jgi:hypothetical protein
MSKGHGEPDRARGGNTAIVRSSAAEYLTYAAARGAGGEGVELRYQDENIWLTQRLMAEIYGVDVRTVNEHLKKIYSDGELDEAATIRNFRIVQTEGSRQVTRSVKHYSLQVVISVGFKVNNERAVQFRRWANQIVREYTIKGFAMDDERLRNGGTILTEQYFEELLERIREIRLSERKLYQKVTDIYATSIDYDRTAKATRRFYARVQSKLHQGVHGQTPSELIYSRADAEKDHMGLTSWEGSPSGKVHKYDVTVAKNYLTKDELQQLSRLVSAYLDLAETQAMRRIPMTMEDWEKRLDGFIELLDPNVRFSAGTITAEQAKLHADSEFERYRIVQDRLYESDFDRLGDLEEETKSVEGDHLGADDE